jgi:hypothetical protein
MKTVDEQRRLDALDRAIAAQPQSGALAGMAAANGTRAEEIISTARKFETYLAGPAPAAVKS